ncbi:MAG: PQQ-binding-like beta-propeller repeat protein, partial [Planctomycetia bacterium]|nr:PQQ-binding-like beta-propeller repeat protein [Planctomycetia bacterium]
MKRWRAFLVVASINSTLALVYWAVFIKYFPQWLPSGRWLSPQMFTVYLLVIAGIGLLWAGRRYRRMASEEPSVTGPPSKTELYSLTGLTAFAAISVILTGALGEWQWTVDMPLREFTFIGIALFIATIYALYRKLTRSIDTPVGGTESTVRLSLSGEFVGLGTLVLCGVAAVLLMGTRTYDPITTSTVTGDAEANFVPRWSGTDEEQGVAIEAIEMIDGKPEKVYGRVMSNLALDGDRIIFGVDINGEDGRILAINRHSGKVEWSVDAPGMKAVFCTPTVANGKVYCGEGMHHHTGCRLFCANAKDGSDGWEKPFRTASHTEGAPAVANGKVYFPAGDDGLFCADANTGAQLWQFPGGKEKGIHIDAAPAVSNGTVFVGSGLYSYVAVALDANTGTEKWRTDLKLRAFGAPLVSGSKVFYGVGTGNMGADTHHYTEEGPDTETKAAGAVVCLEAASGKEQWRYDLPKSVHTGLAADAFSVYAGARDGCVYALDRKSGKLRWRASIGGAVLSCPAVASANGFPVAVYAVSQEGLVVCLHPQTGSVLWQKRLGSENLPHYRWYGTPNDVVMCSPLVVTTPTATGSKRTIYIGAMTVDPQNPINKKVAVFRFEDEIGE